MANNPFDATDDADEPTDDQTTDALFDDPGPITRRTAGRGEQAPETTPADRDRVPDADAVEGTAASWAAIAEAATLSVQNYRAHTTRNDHYHEPTKHDLTDVFNVNPDLVAEVLYYAPDDHAAVHELIARREELVALDMAVFTDTSDADEDRWHKIESAAPQARVAESTLQSLIDQFDYDEQFDDWQAPSALRYD